MPYLKKQITDFKKVCSGCGFEVLRLNKLRKLDLILRSLNTEL